MVERIVVVTNPLGIHARPAALIVQCAADYTSEISLSKGDVAGVNGKSIMGVMMLAAENGSEVKIVAEGMDAEVAVRAIGDLLESNFEESA
ncbi:MAG: phosphocarrier protein HPr [Gemmatimonadetes bacterium]|jgi:phosphocarrier protein HPr|nr:phosphocarrier protein HPr [Gemmatimonadota bacterium]|tara:strand:- start:177 stop:449 length:273 start_codon:yes stop_codon:yes gene_type:complete